MKYNQSDYRFYVVRWDTPRPLIDSGWEYREDAEDQVDALIEEKGERKARVLTRRGMHTKVWGYLNPNKNADWFTPGVLRR